MRRADTRRTSKRARSTDFYTESKKPFRKSASKRAHRAVAAPISAYSSTPHGCGPLIRTMPSIGFGSSEAFKTSSHLSSWAHMLDPAPVISPVGNTAWRSERASRFGATWAWKPTFGNYPTTIARCCPRPLRFTNITASSFTGDLSSRRSACRRTGLDGSRTRSFRGTGCACNVRNAINTVPQPVPIYRAGRRPSLRIEAGLARDLRPKQTNHKDALSDAHWSGDWLMSVGLSLPILQPESC